MGLKERLSNRKETIEKERAKQNEYAISKEKERNSRTDTLLSRSIRYIEDVVQKEAKEDEHWTGFFRDRKVITIDEGTLDDLINPSDDDPDHPYPPRLIDLDNYVRRSWSKELLLSLRKMHPEWKATHQKAEVGGASYKPARFEIIIRKK